MAIRGTIGETYATVEGERISMTGPSGTPTYPKIIRGHVYAPVERIISLLSLGHATEASMDNQDPLIMILEGGVTFEAASQRDFAMLGGVKIPLGTCDSDGLRFEILRPVMYGPIESLARILGLKYIFDAETKTFTIDR